MTTKPVRVLFDPQAGDDSPLERNIAALATVSKEFSEDRDVSFKVAGNQVQILEELRKHGYPDNIEITHVPDVFRMDGKVADYKGKHTALTTISVLADMLKDNEGDVLFSTGNTTATVYYPSAACRRLAPGVRPSLVTQMPLEIGKHYYLADAGATKNVKPMHLFYNALLTSLYLQRVKSVEKPRVALLEGPLAEEAENCFLKVIEDSPFRFIGTIKPSSVYKDVADVLVTDGFNGNVYLKATEAAALGTKERLKKAKKSQFIFKREELFSPFFAPNAHGYERLQTLESEGYRIVPVKNIDELEGLINSFPPESYNYNAAVLSNGEEDVKGNKFAQDLAEILRQSSCNYIGFVEPEDVIRGTTSKSRGEKRIDMVFTQYKTAELFASTVEASEKAFLGLVEPVLNRLDLVFRRGRVKESYQKLKKSLLDSESYDRAPVLGINGYVVVGHGSDGQRGTEQGLRFAIQYFRSGFVEHAKDYLKKHEFSIIDR